MNAFVLIEYLFDVPSFKYKVNGPIVCGYMQLVVCVDENARVIIFEVLVQVVPPFLNVQVIVKIQAVVEAVE